MTRHSGLCAILAAALLLPLGAAAAHEAKPAPTAAAKAARDERQCSMPTSTRLQKKNDDCSQARESTRSYSNRELNSTGQFNAVDALRRLDPSVH
jgi:hypothetical protein